MFRFEWSKLSGYFRASLVMLREIELQVGVDRHFCLPYPRSGVEQRTGRLTVKGVGNPAGVAREFCQFRRQTQFGV